MSAIISIDHISKVFKTRGRTLTAVDDITFDVQSGEIFGLLGSNGAGKSTLIRILTTLLVPSSGTATVGGHDITKDPEAIRRIIGVCPQNGTLDAELTAYDNLEFYGKLVDVDDKILDARIWELLDSVGLRDFAYARAGTFSGGMKRKLEIVRAFIHKPLILFLDEPTIGLDPESRREVWVHIEQLNQAGTTIILTTHYMDEAEKLCARVAFVHHGKLIQLDTMDNLKRSIHAGEIIEIELNMSDEGMMPALRSIEQITDASIAGNKLVLTATNATEALPSIWKTVTQRGRKVVNISIRPPSLEDVFIYLTGGEND